MHEYKGKAICELCDLNLMTEEIFHDEIHLLEAKSKLYMMRLISWPKKSLLMQMNNLNVDEVKLDDECSKESTLNESIKKFVDKTTGTTLT